MNAVSLATFALLGLAGSLHCAGMCGAFALSLGLTRASRTASWFRAALYLLGKSLAYVLLARLLASCADALLPEWLVAARSVLAYVAGGAMVLSALAMVGAPALRAGPLLALLRRGLQPVHTAARDLPAGLRGLSLGFANGLLPCGLSWSAIALAAASAPATSVLGPLVFGAATGPVLIAIAWGAGAVSLDWRRRARPALALVLAVAGVWTAWRGGRPRMDGAGKDLPPCCEQTSTGTD